MRREAITAAGGRRAWQAVWRHAIDHIGYRLAMNSCHQVRKGHGHAPVVTSLLALVLGACGGSEPGASAAVVRDSAGITIVENGGPAWEDGEGWQLGATPLVEIGAAEGAPEYLLSQVRSVTRAADGRIFLFDGGSTQIRVYDPEGGFLFGFGRKGGGPGEFESVEWIALTPGDTVVVYDRLAQRLTRFDPAGQLVGAFTLPGESYNFDETPQILSLFPDGSLLARLTLRDRAAADGPRDQRDRLLHLAEAGAIIDTIVTLRPLTTYMTSFELNGGAVGRVNMPVRFGASSLYEGIADRVVAGMSDEGQFTLYTTDGGIDRIIRMAIPPVPVTEVHLEALAASQQARSTPVNADLVARMAAAEAAVPHATALPFFRAVRGDDSGNIWAQRFALPGVDPAVWTVIDRDGVWLGDITLPARFTPWHIGDDFVLGVWRDDFDVERVSMYALEKG